MATPVARINVSIRSNDSILNEVLARIRNETLVETALGEHGVEGVVKNVRGLVGGRMLDLIAHAKNGVLRFGDWEIDGEETNSVRLRESWGRSKPKTIRLLGCNTAATTAGQQAMRHLKAVFGVKIFGATGPLSALDFDAGGLSESVASVLSEVAELEPPEDPDSFVAVERWWRRFREIPEPDSARVFSRLRAETDEDAMLDRRRTRPRHRWAVKRFTAEDRRCLFAQLIPQLATAPGLLAVPESEALFPADDADERGAPRFHRVTFLLGRHFVRIYPIGRPEGVILRSRDVLELDGGIPVARPPDPTSECPPSRS